MEIPINHYLVSINKNQTKNNMKRIVYLVALVFISTLAFGQKVDFSGTWKLNKDRSTLGEQFSMAPQKIIIKHDRKTIELEKHAEFQGEPFTYTDVFTLDGKECENPGWGNSIKKSTAEWNKKAQMLTIDTKFPMQDGGEVTIKEELALLEGTLQIVSSASSSYGDLEENVIYEKE